METRSSLSLSLSHSSHTSHYSGDENLSDVSRRCLLDCLICLFLYSLSLSLSRAIASLALSSSPVTLILTKPNATQSHSEEGTN